MIHSDQENTDSPEESPLMDPMLMGEKILNKKAVYEPSSSQRCRQLMCSRQWAVAIVVTMGLFILIIAIIAAFARPGATICASDSAGSQKSGSSSSSVTPAPKAKTYISTDGRPFPWKSILLPRDVIPESYEIFLHPKISQSRFDGKVTIHCAVVNPTDFVVFHVKELNVTKVSVLRGEVEVEVADKMEYTENEQMWVKVAQRLAGSSKIAVVVEFSGALISKLAGFYKSSYKTSTGETREIATTHFEPTDARTAFPCFDEPDLKANFSLSMVREKQHISLFNMPLKSSTPYGEGLMKDDFEMSVKMSTYLVAFVVCDFKNVSSHTSDQKTQVRVFAPEEQISQANYALEVAVKVLDYYNEFFGVPYPLPKQDMIAIPDFSAGAMENWGLITYRMTSILYDPERTSASSKQWITIVIAHELAHQWFGNIVTMKWWDDLWLNEGFASFVEYLGAAEAEPSFGMEDQFVSATLQQALYLDSFTTSHPIQVPVNDPAEINEIFDKISYDKGASLIAMVQAFMGKDKFQEGLHSYLLTHAYSNARTDDLWDTLQKASSMDSSMTVKDVMDTWTLQMGYPVITVKRKPGSNQVTLSQQRFLLSEGTGEESKYKSPYNYTWKVPFTYRTKNNPNQQLVWLTDKEMTLTLTLAEGEWIKGNMRSGGFYRVNYEPALWRLLIQQLKDKTDELSVRDRAGLLDDAFALARAGQLSYDIVFELLAYLGQETEFVPLDTALVNYRFIMGRMYVTDVLPKMQKYLLNLISERLNALGWTNQDQHLPKLLQAALVSAAITLEDKKSIKTARQLFDAGNWTNIPDNLRQVVYTTAVHYGDDDIWQQVFQRFKSSTVPTEEKQFRSALSYTRDPRRIQLFLRDALDNKVIRSQDSESVISGIASQATGHLFAWRFVQQNWDTLYDRYSLTSFQLGYLLKAVIAPFNTQFDYDEVEEFFKDKKLGSGKMSFEQSLETVRTHIDWTSKFEESISKWFSDNVKV